MGDGCGTKAMEIEHHAGQQHALRSQCTSLTTPLRRVLEHLFWSCVPLEWPIELGFSLTASAQRRLEDGRDAQPRRSASEPADVIAITASRIERVGKTTQLYSTTSMTKPLSR